MTFIISLLANLASLGGVILDAISLLKKSGKDERDAESLRKEAEKDEKTIDELAKANEFILRLERDPAYRERMRELLNKQDGSADPDKS